MPIRTPEFESFKEMFPEWEEAASFANRYGAKIDDDAISAIFDKRDELFDHIFSSGICLVKLRDDNDRMYSGMAR